MAIVCSRYNARSDWPSVAKQQGIILPYCPRADYGLCKLGRVDALSNKHRGGSENSSVLKRLKPIKNSTSVGKNSA